MFSEVSSEELPSVLEETARLLLGGLVDIELIECFIHCVY